MFCVGVISCPKFCSVVHPLVYIHLQRASLLRLRQVTASRWSYTPAVSQLVKPMASHSIIFKLGKNHRFSQVFQRLPCCTPSKFESSPVITLPIKHLKFQLNQPTDTWAIGRTGGKLRLKAAKIILFSKCSAFTLAYIVTPQWNVDHSYSCPPSITS